MKKPLINYDGVEREMTDEEWQIHQEYQAETRSLNETPADNADALPDTV